MINLQSRLHDPEQLDNLSLSGQPLKKALLSLKWINTVLGNHYILGKQVLSYCKKNNKLKKFRIVDLGCGGGDTLHYIAKKLKEEKIDAELIGIDGNPQSIEFARSNTKNINNLAFETMDILSPDFKLPQCDLIISSHFIYHFKDKALINFLKRLTSKNSKYVIFSELYRNKMSYYLFKFTRTILPISRMASRKWCSKI